MMKNFLGRVLILPAASLLMAGCPLIEAEITVPDVCVTLDDITMTAAPEDFSGEITVTEDVSEQAEEIRDILNDLEDFNFEGDLKVKSTTVSLVTGNSFDFIDSFSISLNTSDQFIDVVNCDSSSCPLSDSVMTLEGDPSVDFLTLIQSDDLEISSSVSGDLPMNEWELGVTICFQGKSKVSY